MARSAGIIPSEGLFAAPAIPCKEKGFGLYDYNARYYSPVLGRFISPDSIVLEPAGSQGWNRYSYVNNNPIRYTDSTGHCIDPVSGTVCLVVAAKIALEATLLIATVVIVTSEPFQEGASELGQALGDVLIPPAVPREQEGFSLDPLPDAGVYQPGPTLGGEFSGPLHLPGPELGDSSIPTFQGTPLERPEVLGDNVLSTSTLQPGPYAGASIPARGPERDFTEVERMAIDIIGYSTGCHTCGTRDPGTRSGHFIPDHQPPSALNVNDEPQRLYPHCISCSRRQGGEVSGALR